MHRNELVSVMRYQPFEAFTVHLSDGGQLSVGHPEQAMLSERSLYVAQNGTARRCSIMHISRISVEDSAT